jgi:predicted dehydrogenase
MSANGIAVVGAGMIGAAHAFGYRAHLPRFAGRLPGLALSTVCDADVKLATAVAAIYGFAGVADDWRRVMADPSIGIVSICLPNFLHAEIMEAALDAGKHVICEKPLAIDAATARRLYDKARSTGTRAATVFNYRRIPAVAEIRDRIRKGEIGDPLHALVQYQSEYAADPALPHSWRYDSSRAGPGALLDVGTHAIDAARYLCGDVVEVHGAMSTISVKERFLPAGSSIGHDRVKLSGEKRAVDNDDVVSALLKFENGCQGMFSASRVAVGMGNTLSFAVSGSRGTVRYTSERPGQFEIAVSDQSGFSAFATIPNRPASPYASLLPVPHDGVAVGYAESFGFMINEFLAAIAEDREVASGSLLDGLRAAEILDAIHRAANDAQPVAVSRHASQ